MEKQVGDWMNFMIFSTTLCGNYDRWVNNPYISEIINVNTNPMCINLKQSYPDVEDKVIQSMTLGFLYNVYHTISQHATSNDDLNDDNEMDNLNDDNYLDELCDSLSVD